MIWRSGLSSRAPGRGSFVSERGAQQSGAVVGEERLELAAGVALVGDEGLAGAAGEEVGLGLEHVAGDFAFVGFGVGEGEA